MKLTPPRTDLPEVGDEIAVLNGCRSWYIGPLTVLAVDHEKQTVEARPERWKHPGTMFFRPFADGALAFNGQELSYPGQANPIFWNKITDLREDERP